MSYLEEVIIDVLENYSDKIDRLVFVTTGKRPALFLKKHFAEQVKHATISPEFIGIADLFTRISGVEAISNLPLLFEFYDCYIKTCKETPDSFEEFLGWGQTALKDFSEIDQYLVDPDRIFPYIHALKEVEHWSGMDELTEMQVKYLKFWESLGEYYFALNSRLDSLGKGYGGFIAKKAVEKLPEYLQREEDTIHIFVGFNALSKAEQRVIHTILMDIGGEIYWDGDRYFLENPAHDAGYFLRKYLKDWPYYNTHTPKFIGRHYQEAKAFYLTGVPKSVNQAHSVATLLKNISGRELEKTGLIIADEHLLIPILQTIASDNTVNITMGYPLQQTPLNDLFTTYFRLHLSKSYYYKDVLNLLSQPFLHSLLKEESIRAITEYIKGHNLTYLTRSKLFESVAEDSQEVLSLFFPENKGKDKEFIDILIDNAITLIYRLKDSIDPENTLHILIQEYAYRFYELFNQLKQIQKHYGYINSVKTLYHFYLDVLQKSTLNFRGEPLEGLQVMGVLESRSLDFENVIITSVNEGVLPLGKSDNSLIPYDVKFELGLPTYKERDAVYSYNFYHILQRAKKAYLFYDTEMNSFKSKEKSRFILQLLAEKIATHKIVHQIKAPEVYPATLPLLSIEKNETIFSALKELAEKGLSPSAITTYIRNPITFYEQNVLQVYEEAEVEETIEARTFGNIVHATLEDLYTEPCQQKKVLGKEDIQLMKTKVKDTIYKNFEEAYKNADFKTGKNWLIFNVINKYINRFLDIELAEINKGTTIEVLYLEQKIKVPFKAPDLPFTVNLKGIVDRVDRRNGKLHIIDYKTGVVEPADVRLKDWEYLITDIKYGKAFQLLTYAYMLSQHLKIGEPILASNLSFKRLQHGLITFNTYIEKKENTEISSSVLSLYAEYTAKLLQEIFDIEKPFTEII